MAQQNATEKHNEKSQSVARSGGMAPARLFPTPAELFRWNPFTAMGRVMEEMERMMGTRSLLENGGTPSWAPAIEISRNNGDLEIRADLPGLKPEDVKVEITADALVLEGERKFEHEEKKDGVYRTERQYGHFYRSIPLPDGADVENAQARFENGVLAVKVPVAETQGSHRQIPVEAGSAATMQK